MKLLTEEIKQKLRKIQPTEGDDFICKFFNPCGSWTWYVMEGEELENGDWLFFGFVDGDFPEYGSFLLSELVSVTLPLGLHIERDMYFDPQPKNPIVDKAMERMMGGLE